MLQSKAQPATNTAPQEAINGGHDRKAQIESVLRETNGRVYDQAAPPPGWACRRSTLESRIRALKINKHCLSNTHGTRHAGNLSGVNAKEF